MAKDPRYNTAQKLISGDFTKTLQELFEVLDETPLAKDMKTSPARLTKLVANPELFTFRDCYKIAALLEVDEKRIIDIVHNQHMQDKKSKKKR